MHNEQRFMVRMHGESRECRKEGTIFVHVLNSAWRVDETDPRIEQVGNCGNIVVIAPEDKHEQ